MPNIVMVLSLFVFTTFLILKLSEKIDWSWWWVTSPVWGGSIILVLWVAAGLAAISGIFSRFGY